jgi:hypothetical protein
MLRLCGDLTLLGMCTQQAISATRALALPQHSSHRHWSVLLQAQYWPRTREQEALL